MSKSPPENPEVVDLSVAIAHPLFDPALRDLVKSVSQRQDAHTLMDIVLILGVDPEVLAQSLVANAVAAEFMRCREADAAKRGRLN